MDKMEGNQFTIMEHASKMCFTERDIKIFPGGRLIIGGVSDSGKSFLSHQLILKYHHEFKHIVICGVEKHEIQKQFPEEFVTVSREIIDPIQYQIEENDPILFVIDDVFMEAINSKIVLDSFTKGRHSNLSTILITQNIFGQGKFARSVALNATHILLTRGRGTCQVEILFRQLFGKRRVSDAILAYKEAVLSRPYGYILIDLNPKTPEILQLRTDIVGESSCERVYQLTA